MANRARGFAHLHVHSEYSGLDSTAKMGDLVNAAAEMGQTALAVTDHGNLAGIYDLVRCAEGVGITPIPGLEAYLAIGSRFERNTVKVRADGTDDDDELSVDGHKIKKYEHITLLATTKQGWRNLVALHNASQDTRWSGKPRIDYDLIARYSQGLVILTGCLGGPVLGPLSRGKHEEAESNLRRMIDVVGRDNVYIELMEHGIRSESAILPDAVALARAHQVGIVATNDCHYTCHSDARTHEAWLALKTHARLTDPAHTRFTFAGSGYHLRSEKEMRALRPEDWWAEACDTTVEIASRVEKDILPEVSMRLPRFPVPEGYRSTHDYFVELVKAGAKAKYGDPYPKEVADRLNWEAKVIKKAGIVDYFLIVHELLSWARSQGIAVGPGRGSAAGSCVSYCLDIVTVDPMRFGLLFERFLDPTRVGMPDIDMDFEPSRREEVIAHLTEMYGEDHVARIGTFAVSKTKRAINQAVQVLDLPVVLGRELNSRVPMNGATPYTFAMMDESSEAAADFFAYAAKDERCTQVLSLARAFENTVAGLGIHACGIVISDIPLTDFLPMRRDSDNPDSMLISEWDAHGVEGMGLVKLDCLGLRNLDIVSETIRQVHDLTSEHLQVDALPDPDDLSDARVRQTWELIAAGRTEGIFQLESSGMRELAQDVAPTSLEHLGALVALYRPGPLGANMHTRYAARKNRREKVSYSLYTRDRAEQREIGRVLSGTYGLIVYQEDAMHLGDAIAGFTAAEKNRLRKSISKKNAQEVAAVGQLFLAGAQSRHPIAHVDSQGRITWDTSRTKPVFAAATAHKLWDGIKSASQYSFNKSHAVAYGYLAFVTAFLKANWPAAYGAALLAKTAGDERRSPMLAALAADGITISPPDVNVSDLSSRAVSSSEVVLGLTEIKDVGKAAHAVVAERQAGGVYSSLADLAQRVRLPGTNGGRLSSKVLISLIEAGACDSLGPRRGHARVAPALRARPDTPVPDEEWGSVERSIRQLSRLGVCVGTHPMAALRDQIKRWRPRVHDDWGQALGVKPIGIHRLEGQQGAVATVGVVTQLKFKQMRHGQMGIMRIDGSRASIEAVMWNQAVKAAQQLDPPLSVGSVVGVLGTMRTREIQQDEVDEMTGEVKTTTVTVSNLAVSHVWTIPYRDQGEYEACAKPVTLPMPSEEYQRPARPRKCRSNVHNAQRDIPTDTDPEPVEHPAPTPAEHEDSRGFSAEEIFDLDRVSATDIVWVEEGDSPELKACHEPFSRTLKNPPVDLYEMTGTTRIYRVTSHLNEDLSLLVVRYAGSAPDAEAVLDAASRGQWREASDARGWQVLHVQGAGRIEQHAPLITGNGLV